MKSKTIQEEFSTDSKFKLSNIEARKGGLFIIISVIFAGVVLLYLNFRVKE